MVWREPGGRCKLTKAHGEASWNQGTLIYGLIVVRAHDEGVIDGAAFRDEGAQPNHGVVYPAACPDDGAIPQNAVADLCVLHLAGRQEAGHGVDGGIPIIEAASMCNVVHG